MNNEINLYFLDLLLVALVFRPAEFMEVSMGVYLPAAYAILLVGCLAGLGVAG